MLAGAVRRYMQRDMIDMAPCLIMFKPYALPLAILVLIGMFGTVALYNKVSTGRALPGQTKSERKEVSYSSFPFGRVAASSLGPSD